MAYTAIDDPSAHFQTLLYTGDGNDDRSLTNDGNSDLKPDFVWIKSRGTTNDHLLFDSSRGIGKYLRSNANDAETDNADTLQAFETDGIEVGTDSRLNTDADTIVAWQWKANGGTRTTNTESGDNPGGGYQANATAGFSIIDYVGTGAAGTKTHGLGAVPHLMIVKNRATDNQDWVVYHHKNTAAPETDYLNLNTSGATADTDGYWNDTAPTSSVFTLKDNTRVNEDGVNIIAYLWTEIQGYSKFGSYTGNNNADGPFVYTGFKPAFVLFKATAGTENWGVFDNKRNTTPGNPRDIYLAPSSNAADSGESDSVDFLSNGFKWRIASGFRNGDGVAFIYMAFAEQPFVTSGGVPCTAS